MPNKLLGLTSKQSKPEQIRKLPYFNYPFPDTNQASGGRTQTYDREQKHAASAVVCVRSSAPGVQRKLRILLAKSAGSCVTSPALLQTEVRSLTCEKPPSLGQTRILLDTSVCKRGGGKCHLKKETGIQKDSRWLLRACYDWWKNFGFSGTQRNHNPAGQVRQPPERSTSRLVLCIGPNRTDDRPRWPQAAPSQAAVSLVLEERALAPLNRLP